MTPPMNPYRVVGSAHYDLGVVRIVDHNGNGRYDAGVDSLEPTKAKNPLKKLGLALKEGADLGDLAYRANLLQARKDANAGDLVKARESLSLAAVHIPLAKQADFERQSGFVLFSAASRFLKLSEAKRQAQAKSLGLEDLSLLRAAAKFQAALKPKDSVRFQPILEGLHRGVAEAELKDAEDAAQNCLSISVAGALLSLAEASFQGGLGLDVERIEKIQARMESLDCNIDWSKKTPEELRHQAK